MLSTEVKRYNYVGGTSRLPHFFIDSFDGFIKTQFSGLAIKKAKCVAMFSKTNTVKTSSFGYRELNAYYSLCGGK